MAELTNGNYRVFVTLRAGGYSAWRDLALTRRSGDPLAEAEGVQLFIKDQDHEVWWRAGAGQDPADCVNTALQVAVLPGADVELRRVTLACHGSRPARLQVTSFLEVALNRADADAAHPAFSKLFVQTEAPAPGVLLASRRPRSPEEAPRWMGHSFWIAGAPDAGCELETDRVRFIGRGRSLRDPAALDRDARLTGRIGNVLDPILALRLELQVAPGDTIHLVTLVAAGEDRDSVLHAINATRHQPLETMFSGARSIVMPGAALPPTDAPFKPCLEAGVAPEPLSHPCELKLFNGWGGFSEDGAEYIIRLSLVNGRLRLPPMPWANVIANPNAGFIATERGIGTAWTANSRENRLTPWSNDPVSDPASLALYLRDEERGVFWSPLPGPVAGAGDYDASHGFGYTRWIHRSLGLDQEVVAFVPPDEPVTLTRIRIWNPGPSTRRLSGFGYLQWALGGLPTTTGASIATTVEGDAVLAVNPDRGEFSDRVAFAALRTPGAAPVRVVCDRMEFLGQDGCLDRPAMVTGEASESGTGGGPCAAFHVPFTLGPDSSIELLLVAGEAADWSEARRLLQQYDHPDSADGALQSTRQWWSDLVTRIQVTTPSPALDVMANGWLVYQNLSCRMWGRSAFYQSGGAYGFRDQLQDAGALVQLLPELARSQILLHAAHQFPEGDVLHWWHPPASKGIRTRFSDDLLWLPFVLSDYLQQTGDFAVLDQRVGFVTGRTLAPGEDEIFLAPGRDPRQTDLYEHCCLALDRSLTRGAHGLPLMGTGDWNDGMNRVGREGRGESVWLGFFLHLILDRFIPLCERRGDSSRATRYREYQRDLAGALNRDGWDGGWYRRAFYDDGAAVGSAASDECRIDAIAQAWAVISGVAPADRAARALDAAMEHLVDEPAGIIRLLTPPFDRTPHDPGYIKGYLPGVRENGGQYTHGALWLVRALAEQGRTADAGRLLEMLSPATRGANPAAVQTYQVEPYVIAADVYGTDPHVGRGGWTWYTGSAGWMQRVLIETILGFTLEGGARIVLRPRIPPDWPGYTLRYRVPGGETVYEVRVEQAQPPVTATSAKLDDEAVTVEAGGIVIPLLRDNLVHRVTVRLGQDVIHRLHGL